MTGRARLVGGGALASLLAVAILLVVILPGGGSSEPEARAPGKAYTGDPILSPFLEEVTAKGNVVILHRDAHTPRGTRNLAAGAPASLRESGLAVIFEREPTLDTKLAAIAGGRILHANHPRQLREFVDRALGRAGSHMKRR